MATITLRLGKGSPLTNSEVDDNFTNLNTELGTKANSSALASYLTTATAASTYLPLAGGTLTGQLTIGAVGTANSPTLRLNTSSSGAFVHTQENFAANLTSGQHIISVIGKVGSTKNSGYIGYTWAGDASNSNYVTIGHWGNDDLLRVYADGNVTVGANTVLHAGNYNSYAPTLTGTGASGTWAINITGNAATATSATDSTKLPLAGGTLTGKLTLDGRNEIYGVPTNAGTIAGFMGGTSGGTTAARTQSLNTQTLLNIAALGYTGSAWVGGAGLSFVATENQAAGTRGTKAVLTAIAAGGATGTTLEWNGSTLSIDGNTALHSGNYNSYSPTLTGTGASGTWGISISGNSATTSQRAFSGDISTTGQGRFTGWYAGGAATGLALETGISGGVGYVIAYNRNTATYSDLELHSANLRLLPQGGTLTGPGGSVILHAGNYNSYAPTLTGTGASGTWGISITGSAGSASSATVADRLQYNDGPRDLSDRLPTTFTRTVVFDFVGAGTGNGSGNYAGVMTYSPWTGTSASTGDSSYQLSFANTTGVNASGQPKLSIRNGIDSTWNAWYVLLHSGNYNSYSPTLTGTNASGTWGISITGTANVANSATSAGYLTGGDSGFYGLLYNGLAGDLNTYNSPGLYSAEYTGSTNKPSVGANGHIIQISDAGGTDVKTQWYFPYGGSPYMRLMWGNTNWGSWLALLTSSNYNSYAPTLTGTGASGTWGISISGNSATTSQSTFGDLYTNGWFRNNNSNQGLYNQVTTQHLSSNTNGWWDMSSTTSTSGIRLYSGGHVATIRGHVYADSSNNIGFLTNDVNWALKVDSSKNVLIYGSDLTVGTGGSSNIYMSDSDEGTRRIHCNSNRIGFLNQSDGWGAYCDDAGNWAANNLSGTNTGDQTNISGNAATASKTSSNSGYVRVGTGMAPFFNWGGTNGGAGAPSDSTYTTGIDVGSHPSDQAYGFQIASNMWNVGLWTRTYNSGFSAWVRVLDSANYNSYSPTLTGGGASGTWGINITGSAATATDSTKVAKAGDTMTGALNINAAPSGRTLSLGGDQIDRVYNDTSRSSLVINATDYPHLYINATGAGVTNTTHGGVFSMTGRTTSGFRRFSIGVANYNPNEMSFGWYDNDANPHYGVGLSWAYPASVWFDTSHNWFARGSMRAPIFYDSDNTAYYTDPASATSGSFAGFVGIGNSYGSDDGGWGSRLNVGGGPHARLDVRCANDGIVTTMYSHTGMGMGKMGMMSNHPLALMAQSAVIGGYVYAGSIRAPIFYDSDDTTYYVDPASTSNLNQVNLQGYLRRNISNSGYLEGNYSTASTGDTANCIYTIGGSYQPGTTNLGNMYGVGYTTGNGTSNPGLGMTGWGLYVASGGTSKIFLDSDSGTGIATTSWRAPIFYDRDNTAYYTDPASTSNINALIMAGTLKMYGGSYYGTIRLGSSDTWACGISQRDAGNAEMRIWAKGGTSGSIYFATGFDGEVGATTLPTDGMCLKNNTVGIGNFGAYTSYPSYKFHVMGTGYSTTDFRAPVFYDSNDTAYYVDPNAGTYVYGGIINNGAHGSSYIQNRLLAANNGASTGEVQLRMWCSEPGVSWDGAGFGYNVYNDGGGNGFGKANASFGQAYMRMTSDGNWYFYNVTTGGTRYMTMQLHSTGYVTATHSSRAPLFYDSDNTGYYVDPNSTSRMGTINADTLYSYGNVTAYSDERLKKDWETLPTNFVEELAKVKSGTYTRIDSGERQVGVGAQSLQAILKEAVSEKEEYLGVHYGNAALASAVELAKEVVDLRNRVAHLESLIHTLIGD